MKELGEISLFHRFTNPRPDKSVYFWSWGSYFLFILAQRFCPEIPLNPAAAQMFHQCFSLDLYVSLMVTVFYVRSVLWNIVITTLLEEEAGRFAGCLLYCMSIYMCTYCGFLFFPLYLVVPNESCDL